MDISFYKNIKYPLIFIQKLITLIIKYNKYINEKENVEENLQDTPIPLLEQVNENNLICEDKNEEKDNLEEQVEKVINNIDEKENVEENLQDKPNKPIPLLEQVNENTLICEDKNEEKDSFKNLKLNDEFIFYFMKYFLRIFHSYLIDIDILKLFKLIKKTHPKTYKLIESHQEFLNINIRNLKKLLEYKKRVPDSIMKRSLKNQIEYWDNKSKMLEGINDSTFGEGFMIKLLNNEKNEMYQRELINRLVLIKELFGLEFFTLNEIVVFTFKDFEMFDYQIRSKIYLKLILKLRFILKNNIKILKKTDKSLELIKYLYN